MCVIIVATEKHPDIDHLEAAEKQNPHGGAIAWKDKDGFLRYKKDIDASEVEAIIFAEDPTFPYVIHFRITSSGGTRPELCHPFPVNHSVSLKTSWKGKSSLLFHNGTFREWKDMVAPHSGAKDFPKGRIWSDSRAIAWLAYKTKKNIFRFIDERIAILNQDGTVEYYGQFEHEDTFILSNDFHLKKKYDYTKTGIGYTRYGQTYTLAKNETWKKKLVTGENPIPNTSPHSTNYERQRQLDLIQEDELWMKHLNEMDGV